MYPIVYYDLIGDGAVMWDGRHGSATAEADGVSLSTGQLASPSDSACFRVIGGAAAHRSREVVQEGGHYIRDTDARGHARPAVVQFNGEVDRLAIVYSVAISRFARCAQVG